MKFIVPSLRLSCLLLWFLSSALPSLADDWPHWRGAKRNGISDERLPDKALQNIGGTVAWKAEIGTGFASCSVVGSHLFTTGHEDGHDTMFCIRTADGSTVWKHSFPADLGDKFYEGGPGATPTIEGERVYLLSKWGDLFCFKALDGKVIWKKQLRDEMRTGFQPGASMVLRL